jgi:prefoldin subunit 5
MSNIYEASGRSVKLLRKDLDTIKNKTDEINEQLKTISQRISGIEAQLVKIEGHVSTITSSEK